MAPRSESFSTKSAENTVRDTKISDSDNFPLLMESIKVLHVL